MIELLRATRRFVVGEQAVMGLDQVDLTVQQGEYLSIVGPSGSGKSTLLNAIGLLDRLDEGTYRINGNDTSELSDTELARLRREHIGFVFQFFHLISRLSAAQNVELPLILSGWPSAKRRERVQELMLAYGLDNRSSHRPDQLSGGQRQRVAIARATALKPALLLADEPTGNLDSASGTEVVSILEALNRDGITLIIVTHDPALAKRARRTISMVDGKIVGDRQLEPSA